MIKTHPAFSCVVLAALLLGCRTAPKPPATARLAYPEAPRGPVVDDYNGVKVADPYRWMEELDSAETRAWVEAENKLTFSFLEAIPGREAIRKRLTELWDYERYSVPFVEGGRAFFSRNSGLQAQSVWYVSDSDGAEPRVLLDPNPLSKDGTVAVSATSVSDDGRWLAYSLSTAGSDWQEWRVRDVTTATDTDDRLEWTKFTDAAWTKDGKGFFYGRFDQPPAGAERKATNYFQKLCYHRLGTPQPEDPVVYRRDDHKDWAFAPEVAEDGRYLIMDVNVGTDRRNMVFYKDLSAADARVVELLPDLDAQYSFVGNDGPVFFFRTDLQAPRGRLVAIDIRKPERSAWREVIPETKDSLQRVSLVHDTFIASYLRDASSAVLLYDMDGKPLGDVKLPGHRQRPRLWRQAHRCRDLLLLHELLDARDGLSLRRGHAHQHGLQAAAGERRPRRATRLRRSSTPARTGPGSPCSSRTARASGSTAATRRCCTRYGGFDIPETPSFSVSNLVWMEMGGVYALANLRGGGEYGEEWHQAGMFERKQNVFDDFIAAAEWLIAKRYTSRDRLSIYGGSNGGLLVGAVLNQRPDLFGAAVPAVGVMDMLRYQKFTIGWAWASEYGSSDDPKMFPALRAYSPLHNIKPGACYPPTLITTADHDDRVFPAHSFKYAATLQAAQGCANPILIRIETRAGHGAGRPTAKLIGDATDRLAFLTKALKMPAPTF